MVSTRTGDRARPAIPTRPDLRRRATHGLDRALRAVARPLADAQPLDPRPGWCFGDRDRNLRSLARLVVWKVGQRLGADEPVWILWCDGLEVAQYLGSDVSRCLYVGGRYEPNELSFWSRHVRGGMTVIDAGANEGLYALIAATRVGLDGRVVAVEPNPRERAHLQANLDRNQLGAVEIVDRALTDAVGTVELHVAEAAHASQNTLGALMDGDVAGVTTVSVAATTVDLLVEELGLDRVDLMKVDVEGAETRLFRGAAGVLERFRPLLLLEVEDQALRRQGSSAAELERLLAQAKYQLLPFDAVTGRPTMARPVSPADSNVVACPVERLDEVTELAPDASAGGRSSGLTMFSTTRAFEGHFGTIQRNALASWSRVEPRPEVLIFGDDPGAAEICAEFGFTHVPEVATSDRGTPLVSDMFDQAQEQARYDTCCFINSDIIVFPDFAATTAAPVSARFDQFLVVGQRHDLDITEVLPFGPGWEVELREQARHKGRLQPEVAIDYFVFRTGTIADIPPFAIGRGAYDNWLIWHCGDVGMAVVDATRHTTVVHQSHDYSHAGGVKAVWEGPEAQQAHAMIGHWSRYHAVAHARYMIDGAGEVVPARGLKYRLARPRRVASQAVRFTRPVRRWIKYDLAYRLRGRSA